MRIAMMVRGFLPTPVTNDVAYSPATVAKSLAEGLELLGHEVTFFGPEGTNLQVSHIETSSLRPTVTSQQDFDEFVGTSDLFSNYLPGLYDTKMAREMLVRANNGEYDCVVFHHFESVLPLAPLFPDVPIVYVLHDFIDETRRAMIESHSSTNQQFISISDSQRRDAPDLNYIATIYNGIDTEHFTFEDDAEDYLFFSGRITPSKGVREAVQVAVQSNQRLLIAGSLSKSDYWYFDEYIKPYLNDKILFLGMLDKEQLVKYYKKAAALLMPIQWQEPFGLSMAEANACGTPVVAFRRGSVPEIIEDGKNGYIVDNTAEMIMSVGKLSRIKRSSCHKHAIKHFTEQQMVKNYETVLSDVIKQRPASRTTKINRQKLKQRIQKISKKIISSDPRS